MVIDTDERASEGKYLAKGDENGMVDFSERMRYKPTRKQCTPEGAHCSSDDELELFHEIELKLLHFLADEVPDEAIEGLVLGLISEGSTVGVHVRSIDETCTSSITDLTELLRPSHLSRSLLDLAIWVFPLGELGVADHLGVVGSRLADTVHHVMFLGKFTRYALDRVDKGYFSHLVLVV